jgi:protein-disulfide isomerase
MNRIERKHYIFGALIIVIALSLQPFATLYAQVLLGPKLVELIESMKVDPMQNFYSANNIDEDEFALCQADPQIQAIIDADSKLGESLSVTGTPSTFIGIKNTSGDIVLYKDAISGALPEETVMSAIDSKTKVLTTTVIKNQNLHIYGNTNAKTFLVVFSDLECPFCKRFHPTVKSIVDNSDGQIALVHKHFPLSFHQSAIPLAIASECVSAQAGDIGFFKFVEANFGIY